jgi:hypothetical protein
MMMTPLSLERTRWFCAVCFIEGPAELEASRPYPIGGTP